MKKVNRAFDMLTEEERTTVIEYIISHFKTERNEEMDILGAGEILDVVLQQAAPKIYNLAIEDIRAAFKKQSEGFDFELSVLRK